MRMMMTTMIMDYDPEGDNDENEDNNEGDDNEDDDKTEEEMKVDFPNQGQEPPPPPRRPVRPVAVKNMNLIRAPKRGKSGFAEIARWNRTARQGAFNETKRGWMKKRQRDPRNQNELRRRRPGFQALHEIRFYQKSTCFLDLYARISRGLHRQVCLDEVPRGGEFRWQAKALFLLQQAAESYLSCLSVNDTNSIGNTCPSYEPL